MRRILGLDAPDVRHARIGRRQLPPLACCGARWTVQLSRDALPARTGPLAAATLSYISQSRVAGGEDGGREARVAEVAVQRRTDAGGEVAAGRVELGDPAFLLLDEVNGLEPEVGLDAQSPAPVTVRRPGSQSLSQT